MFPISRGSLKMICETKSGKNGTVEVESNCESAQLFLRFGFGEEIDYREYSNDFSSKVCCCVKRAKRVDFRGLKARAGLKSARSFCGVHCLALKNHIIDGKPSDLNEFPHMAGIGFYNFKTDETEFNCGGTLISERFVLTAGHCASRIPGPYLVRLGKVSFQLDLQTKVLSNLND